jgi:hypothetical protein
MAAPIFKYFGAKWRMAAHYPAPKHPTVVEGCAGSATYSLRHNVSNAILFELNPRIYELWRWLINEATEAEVLALPVGLEIGEDLRDVGRRLGLPPGAVELMVRWQRNGDNRKETVSIWGGANPMPGYWSEQIRKRVANTLPLIQGWYVERLNVLDVGNLRDPVTWFVDPPYQFNARSNAYGTPPIDYPRLAEWCKARHGQTIVCEGEGADWLPFEPLKMNKNMRGNQTRELLWTKG